jgi:hypothetical protein
MPRKASAQQLQLDSPLEHVNAHKPPAKPTRRRTESAAAAADARSTLNGGARKPSSAQLLLTPGALLTRSHLRQLGLERRAIDAVFRSLPIVALPGYSRPMIRAEQYLELVEQHTYRDDRVRPCHA